MNRATKNDIFEEYKQAYWQVDKKGKGEIDRRIKKVFDVQKRHGASKLKP